MIRLLGLACILLMFVSVPGCSYWGAATPTPLMPAQMAVNAAVLLEDQFEDPECDASEATVLEAAADVLNAPATLLSVSVAYSVTLGWTIIDFGAQAYEIVWKGQLEPETKVDPEHRWNQVRQWIPFGYATPERDFSGRKPAPCQKVIAQRD